MRFVRVGVIDVGANTLRLLVATTDGGRVIGVHTEKVQLGLGEHVEAEGRLPRSAIEAATKAARREVETARRKGAVRTEIVVTSPGRQASNGHALAAALAAIPGAEARILSAEEEGR